MPADEVAPAAAPLEQPIQADRPGHGLQGLFAAVVLGVAGAFGLGIEPRAESPPAKSPRLRR